MDLGPFFFLKVEDMKLFRHDAPGDEKAGALDAEGRMRDLSLLVPDLTPD